MGMHGRDPGLIGESITDLTLTREAAQMEAPYRAIFLAITGSAALGAGALAQTPQFEVGRPFPDIVLPSLEDGRPTSIADFRGKKVVLHIFASW